MLTQRAWLLGFVGFCFWIIAVVNTLPSFYYVLMWLAIGLLAASLGIAFLSLTGLDFTWKLARSRGHAATALAPEQTEQGTDVAVVEATLVNRGSLNKTGVLVELHLRDELRGTPHCLAYLLEAIPAGQALHIALPLRDLPRGRYTLTHVQLVGSDVLGLFRTRRRVPFEDVGTISIAPALLPAVDAVNSGHGGRARRGLERRARPGLGDELHGVRPYVVGDDLRHIHWKTTARTGELVMREWEQVGQSATLLIWDGAEGSDWGIGARSSIECSLILVASLLANFANSNFPCALATLGQQSRFVPPARGAGADSSSTEAQQTEALAEASAGRTEALGQALHQVWNGTQSYQTAILVSASLAPDVVELARELVARNLRVRVALFDGAALSVDDGNTRRRTKVLRQVAGADSIAVTSSAYQQQAQLLQRMGAQVALCAPAMQDDLWRAMQAMLRSMIGDSVQYHESPSVSPAILGTANAHYRLGGSPR